MPCKYGRELKTGRGLRNLQFGLKRYSRIAALIKPPNHVCKTECLLHVVNVLRMSSYKRGRHSRNFPKTNNLLTYLKALIHRLQA